MRSFGLLSGVLVLGFLPACVGEDPGAHNSVPPGASTTPPGADPSNPGSPTPPGTSSPPPFDGIRGDVVDFGGEPVASATVRIGSKSATTDAKGHFEIADVKDAYDIDVVSPLDPATEDAKELVTSVRGVTTRTPILHVRHPGASRKTKFSGTTLGLTFSGNNQRLHIGFLTQAGLASATTAPGRQAFAPESYTHEVSWLGKPVTKGVYYFLHYTEATAAPNQPLSFRAISRLPSSVSDNEAATVSPVALTTVTSGTVSGTATFPVATTQRTINVGVKLDASDRVGLMFAKYTGLAPDASFATAFPISAGATATVLGAARAPNTAGIADRVELMSWKTNVASGATNVALTFASAPVITKPAETGVMKATSTYQWTGGTAPYRLEIECKGYKASITTMAQEAALPPGLVAGWGTPSSDCTASVASFGHVKTIDDVVSADAAFKMQSAWAMDGMMARTTTAFTSVP